ncbi:MAG TPA: ABC transporter family substrate-binding protein [Pseudonocardia sp.]
MRQALGALLVVLMVALAGCAGAGTQPTGGAGAGAGLSDINPAPREKVRDGGDLRWPIDSLPDNYNYNQFSGTSGAARDIVGAVMPHLFVATSDGGLVRNADYLTSADVTASSPKQTVTYWINPSAVWSNGTPITWRDFEAQWRALSGRDPSYQTASTTGYDDIESVRPGTDNDQVVVTFSRPFAEWQALFSPLYPVDTNATPTSFNTNLIGKLPITSGPFDLDSINTDDQTVTVRRSVTWWGEPPKLDRIIFTVVDRSSLADALADNRIDFYKIGSSVTLRQRAQSIPGVAIRRSPDREYNQITFNGAPGAILSDLRIRQAVAQSIDRTGLARRLVGQIVPDVVQLGNHIYPYGSKYYVDNSAVIPYNPIGAGQALDALGWTRGPDGIRAKNGQPLTLRMTEGVPNPIATMIDQTVRDQLAQIGVNVTIQTMPLAIQADRYRRGDFDLAVFAWEQTATPFSSSRGIYDQPAGEDDADVRQNYGRIFDQRVDTLFDQGLAELDDTKRAAIGNQIDQLLWQDVHDLPLYPSTGAYVVRASLANFGAPGFADVDYVNAGYLK